MKMAQEDLRGYHTKVKSKLYRKLEAPVSLQKEF